LAPPDEGGANVAHDRAVQVRHDHDVELLRAVHELHRGITFSDMMCVRSPFFTFNTSLHTQVLTGMWGWGKETVTELHDVGLVNSRDVLQG
jgi:hypothetical protein